MSVVITLIIIAVLILAHEWGHFIVARRVGIPVHEFSLGFGYKLFSTNRNGVEYSLRLIPLGGFVRMSGEDSDFSDPKGFSQRTPLEKIRVSFAGPFMNFVLALLIFIFTYSIIGIPSSSPQPILGKIIPDKPAAAAGLQEKDRILAVNGHNVTTWNEFTEQIGSTPAGTPMEFKVERNNNIKYINVSAELNESTGLPVIGVLGSVIYERQGIFEAVKIGFQQTYDLTRLMLIGLWTIITGGASAGDLAGPVGITQLVGEAAQVGSVFLLTFAAFLSINLGIINLLPIPALDGSKIVFAVVEAIRRKPMEPEKEGLIHFIGFVFLMLLIVIVTYNDIMRLIKG
ncbi:MAG: RIP metalloprotease RseP [Syntrophomonadaceae bacterium]|nr:RIP metalloprotease RseP [Syntrophomonadaceae bacterium]